MKPNKDEYTILEHQGRLQPFTVWRKFGDDLSRVLRFCQAGSEAELFIEKDIERRLR